MGNFNVSFLKSADRGSLKVNDLVFMANGDVKQYRGMGRNGKPWVADEWQSSDEEKSSNFKSFLFAVDGKNSHGFCEWLDSLDQNALANVVLSVGK